MVGGLSAFRDARVEGRFIAGETQTRFRRWLTPGHRGAALPLPRIKMIVPALQGMVAADSKPSGTELAERRRRPGFFVFVQESLSSPFQQLEAEIAEVKGKARKPDSQELEDRSFLEVGPDPAFSVRSFSSNAKLESALRTPIFGRPIGLTFEREAASPLFASTAFFFELGTGAHDELRKILDQGEELGLVDLFALVSFRWTCLLYTSDAADE